MSQFRGVPLSILGRLSRFYHILKGTKPVHHGMWQQKIFHRINISFNLRQGLKSMRGKVVMSPVPALALLPVVHAAWGFGGSKEEEKTKKPTESKKPSSDELLIHDADVLYSQNKIFELYDLLIPHKDCTNDNILWRLARATCDKSKMTKEKDQANALMYEALHHVERALELNDNNFASHKWYAILLDYVGEIEGSKKRIENAFICKEHFKKAIELNPTDATTIHGLGVWCFTVADMGWVKRKLASTVYATPPTSSYEEALGYFLDAEKAEPNFYSMNLLMLGKTYQRMNKKDLAVQYLTRARDYPVTTEDDKQAHREAIELLKTLGVTSPDSS